ncbi:hypothetical protein D9M73_284350 [compost metagenome]
MRADHRRHGQRHHHRHQNGEGQRQREFAEQPPDDAFHEDQRRKRRHQRNADRQHRKADLLRPEQRRLIGLHALLEIAVHVLDHDDGVVDHEADGHRERHQRQVVDRKPCDPHQGAGPRQC